MTQIAPIAAWLTASERRRDIVALAAIALTIMVLYGHTLGVPWYFDDFTAIVGNTSLHDLSTAWQNIGFKRWIAYYSFALNYHFGGTNVTGYHLVNIAIHGLTSTVVYLLLKRVFPRRGLALAGALLFAAHPLQTQAVTYIVQRMASLCGLFFFTALYCCVRAREALASGMPWKSHRHLFWYGGTLLAGLLAALTKENAVVLPIALYLFARYFPPDPVPPQNLLRYLAPFLLVPLVLAAQYLLVPLSDGQSFAQITGFYRHGTSTPGRYLVTEFSVLWIYLRLLFLPLGQALDYGYPLVQEIFTLRSTIALCGLMALAGLAWLLRRRRPLVSFAIIWFFLTLAVESSLIPLDPLFEHRLYLPMFGFVIVILDLLCLIKHPTVRTTLVMTLFSTLAILSWQRNQLWNDPFSFYEDNLRHAPTAQTAWSNLFGRYVYDGRLADAERLLATSSFAFFDSYLALGKAYFERGQYDKARQFGEAARKVNPSQAASYLLLADVAQRQGELARARDILSQGGVALPNNRELKERLLRLAPESTTQRLANAMALQRQGQSRAALQALIRLSLDEPNHVESLYQAGLIAQQLGDHRAVMQILGRLRVIAPHAASELERQLQLR